MLKAGDGPAGVILRFLQELPAWAIPDESGAPEATILFTDLVGFSRWVVEVGDEPGLELLRAVAAVVEPEITAHRGRLVKRLGDGHMAVFRDPLPAIEAALAMHSGLQAVSVGDHRPQLRIGLHTGQPRRVGADFLGTDVNVAARLCAAAKPGELLVSGATLDRVDASARDALEVRRRRFRAKGAPSDLEAFSVSGGRLLTDL
jgi:adenylate cyclase